MLKRVSSLLLAVVMLLTMVCSFPMAYANSAEIGLAVTADKAEAQRGDTIVVTLAATEHKAFSSIEVGGTYDSNLLTYVSMTDELGTADQAASRIENGEIALSWVSVTDNAASVNTPLATLTFKVKEGVTVSDASNVVQAVVTANIEIASAFGTGGTPDHLEIPTVASEAAVKLICKHTFTGTVTDNGDGSHTGTCSKGCGLVTDYCTYDGGVSVQATHVKPAHTKYTCTACGHVVEDNFTGETLPHTSWTSNNDGTHTSSCHPGAATENCTYGATTSCIKTCVKCGYATKNAGGIHQLVQHYYAPTPTKGGKIQFECSVSGCDHVTNVTPLAAGYAFNDVTNPADWYYKHALYNKSYNIFEGDLDGKFNPYNNITRGEIVIVLGKVFLNSIGTTGEAMSALSDVQFEEFLAQVAEYKVKAGASVKLTDVDGTWYERYAKLMACLGVVNGTSTGAFLGGNQITRVELASLYKEFVAVMGKVNGETYDNFGTPVAAYKDAASVPSWGKSSVEWVRSVGLMQGDTNMNFNPNNKATRAEIAVVMMSIHATINHIVTHIPAGNV